MFLIHSSKFQPCKILLIYSCIFSTVTTWRTKNGLLELLFRISVARQPCRSLSTAQVWISLEKIRPKLPQIAKGRMGFLCQILRYKKVLIHIFMKNIPLITWSQCFQVKIYDFLICFILFSFLQKNIGVWSKNINFDVPKC